MHVNVPRAVFWYPSNSFHTEYNYRDEKAHVRRWHAWLARTEDIDEEWIKSSYFVEHRRKNYSDVCHSKLDRKVSPLPGSGTWEAYPKSYPHKDTDYTWFTFAGEIEDVGDLDGSKPSHWMPPDGDYFRAWGNGWMYLALTTHVSRKYDYSWRQYYLVFRVSIEYWVRSTDQPKNRGQLYLTSGSGSAYVRCYPDGSRPSQWTSTSGFITKDSKWYQLLLAWMNPYLKKDYQVFSDYAQKMADAFTTLLHPWVEEMRDSYIPRGYTWSVRDPIEDVKVPVLDASTFLLHEPYAIMDGVDDMLFGRGFEHYWRNVAVQHAYLDALQHVPRMNDNMISNILEITAFIKSVVVDHRVDVPKSLGDAWLAYRYTYGTTKMDAEEAIRFVHRHMDLGDWTQLKTYGTYSFDYKDTRIFCRCELEVYPKALKTLQKVWKTLYTYGLSPSFYTVWDMIPYSFIVDWFLPIGDVMAAWDAEREYNMAYDLKNVNYSLEYVREVDGSPIHHYTRWYSSTPEPLRGYYFLEDDPSTKTIVKRILDAGALILG